MHAHIWVSAFATLETRVTLKRIYQGDVGLVVSLPTLWVLVSRFIYLPAWPRYFVPACVSNFLYPERGRTCLFSGFSRGSRIRVGDVLASPRC